MKKRRISIILNISALCLCLAAVAIGVYSVKTAQLTVTGTIGFQAHNCDVYVSGYLLGAATKNSDDTLTPTNLFYNKDNTETSIKKFINVHDDTTGWKIGDLYFDDLNNVPDDKIANDIVMTIGMYNDSDFEVYGVFDASTLGFSSSQVEVKVQKDNGPVYENGKIFIKMAAKQTYENHTAFKITFTLKSEEFTQLKLTSKSLIKFTKEKPADMQTQVGDLITMDLVKDDANEAETYRILKINNDGTALVMAMFEANTSQVYWTTNTTTTDANGKTVTKYDGSDLDTYLNTTWYGTLTSTAQTAIVPSNITQYSYEYSEDVKTYGHSSYADYSTKAAVGSAITRNVYALDVEDIENYFGGTAGGADKNIAGSFNFAAIKILFYNTTNPSSSMPFLWLRSANANYSNHAWYVYGSAGSLDTDNFLVDATCTARPAFKIDLSKISYNIAET